MNQITICYRNILETGTVTVTSENAAFPKYRLYDRNLGRLFKGNSFPANFYINDDQGAVISYEVNRLLIPAGHNLDGLALKLQYSTDNFSADINDALSWTQSGSGVIDKSFSAPTKRYWRLNIASPAAAPELAEMVLTKDYAFQANPVLGAMEGYKDNVYSQETQSGLDYDVKFGETKRLRTYDLQYILSAQKTDLEAWKSHCEEIKPFWVYDHNGTLIYMKRLNALEFIYVEEDESQAYYSCRLEFREVLGAIT